MAARSTEVTPTPKDQADTGETVSAAAAAADGTGVAAADAETGDKLISTTFPHNLFGPIVIAEPNAKGEGGISYTLTDQGVIVRGDHVQAVRDAALASHVKLRTLKAPTAS